MLSQSGILSSQELCQRLILLNWQENLGVEKNSPRDHTSSIAEPEVSIELQNTDVEIEACYDVMGELRPHLSRQQFMEQVGRQREQGYKLVGLSLRGEVVALAGFRLSECLAWGRFLYVDDLVTKEKVRHSGFGGKLFEWLIHFARENNCRALHLDSGVQRFDAHRFYLENGMKISSHHFQISW